MRAKEEIELAMLMISAGFNDCEISRNLDIPRRTIQDWRTGRLPNLDRNVELSTPEGLLEYLKDSEYEYVYILGMYLGDGYIGKTRRTYRLRITLDDKYPNIQRECEDSLKKILPNNQVSRVRREGCHDISAYSNLLPLLFPHLGKGKKHERKMELTEWQLSLINTNPRPLLRGFIHSDGCRFTNKVGKYQYPAYQFSNLSSDLKNIFIYACSLLGISTCNSSRNRAIAVNKRGHVELLDTFIGPKT